MQRLLLLSLFMLLAFSSCADYRFQQQDNPFAQYGIKSLNIPIFYNHSNFPNLASPFTREIFRMLSGFKGLKIKSGKRTADATLIGIVTSEDSVLASRTSGNLRSVKNIYGQDYLSKRNDFYVPIQSAVGLKLRIIVMKHPTDEEIKILKAGIGKGQLVSSKVIFTETIPVTGSFTREIFSDVGNQVIGTQNRGGQKLIVQKMAKNAAVTFRDMILYAF